MGKRARLSRVLDSDTRREVIERERGMCFQCGAVGTDVHEIIPRSHWGVKGLDNCYAVRNRVLLCRVCHAHAHTREQRVLLLGELSRLYHYDYTDAPFSEYV